MLPRRNVAKPTKLRESITPGTVLILLAGRFRGKRVVFLKQLSSGLLLVTGPYKINGVPLRRVNQAFVIATSTKVDTTGVDVAKFDDAYFGKTKVAKKKNADGDYPLTPQTQSQSHTLPSSPSPRRSSSPCLTWRFCSAEFFAVDSKKEELSPARKADQKAVDSKLLASVKKTEFMKPYLNSRFTLQKGQAPHAMVF